MKNFLRVFSPALLILSACICAGECLLLGIVPEASSYYGIYVVFLCIAGIGGAILLAGLCSANGRDEKRQTEYYRQRTAELEHTLESLEQDAMRREQFIASFAHELKTPLTAIIGYADMLRSKDMAPKPRFTAAGYIFSEGKRLEALSLKLMDIIVVGKQNFNKKHYDAGYLIREVAAVTVPSVTKDGMQLNIRSEPGEVDIEPDLFKTLLINLVDNARKAGNRGQTIELFGKNEDDGFAFYVRDQGRGMKREDIIHITEPFYMIDKSRSRAQNGAGLGLALCSKIAEIHGTRLEYSSELGKGTTVRVFLKGGEAA